MKTYEILATGPRCGLIECVPNALSVHSIKEKIGENLTLLDYFRIQFGKPKSPAFKRAK